METNKSNKFLIKSKKQMFTVIAIFTLLLFVGGTTYAFFNYTRTGTANTIAVGRISFNTTQASGQNGAINLSNAFPITRTLAATDNTNAGEVVITITGDTTYSGGVEYLVTATDVTNTVNSKTVPISIATIASSGLGTVDEEYFDNRGGADAIYKVLAGNTISNNDKLLVGYIPSGATGVNGTLTIRAFFDKDLISISDTYDETNGVNDSMGTTSEWVNGRTNFTTTEWNTINVSFKIKVEAQEGTWVEEVRTVNAMNTFPTTITDQKANIKEVYFNKMGATAMQNAYDNATIKANLTYNNEGKVLAWLETNTTDNTKYNLIVASDGDTYLTTGRSLFAMWSNEKIEFNNVNTSRVTDMCGMFVGTKVIDLDLTAFDTVNVTDMSSMFFNFNGSSPLKNLTISFDTSSVQRMDAMFSGCSSLTSLDLSRFNTTNVTDMRNMFKGCSALQIIYVSNLWNTNGITSYNQASNNSTSLSMFGECTSLVGTSPNGTTYAFTSYNTTDKTYAVIATDTTVGYLTDIALKPAS